MVNLPIYVCKFANGLWKFTKKLTSKRNSYKGGFAYGIPKYWKYFRPSRDVEVRPCNFPHGVSTTGEGTVGLVMAAIFFRITYAAFILTMYLFRHLLLQNYANGVKTWRQTKPSTNPVNE